MKKQKSEYEKAILSAKNEFISIAGKESWVRESEFAKLFPISMCDFESIRQSILNVAYTRVTLNPIFKEAYLKDQDGRCILDFTYKGLIKIATSEGSIISMNSGVVYSWDKFSSNQGTKSFINHEQNLNPPKDHDEIARNPKLIWKFVKCSYSIATFPNGHESFIILPKWKLLKTWNSTCANASPINQAWPEEWLKKTAIIYHSKFLPKAQRLVTAVSVLNEHEGIKKNKKSESQLMKRMKK